MNTKSVSDAVVTRGAAGRMASQFSNLLFLDHVLKFTDVMIMHHTGNNYSHCPECMINETYIADCSAQLFANADVCQALSERAPDAPSKVADLTLPGFEE